MGKWAPLPAQKPKPGRPDPDGYCEPAPGRCRCLQAGSGSATGTSLVPPKLAPQQSIPPEVSTTQLPYEPDTSGTTLLTPDKMPVPPTPATAAGSGAQGVKSRHCLGPVIVPSPRSPVMFSPQQSTPPEVRAA